MPRGRPYDGAMTLLILADLALLLGLTLRLTRLVVTDQVGEYLVRRPAEHVAAHVLHSGRTLAFTRALLSCPFCIGFWLGVAALATLAAVGGPGAEGTAAVVWRYVAGAFALNWVAAHIGARLGDAGYADDEEQGQ